MPKPHLCYMARPTQAAHSGSKADYAMKLRQFDLNLLVAFDVLMDERNVTRAAERLCVSQSAMSRVLARLRHAFGDELLVRVGRNLEPTEFAASIAERVHKYVLELEVLLEHSRPFNPAHESRAFRIGVSDYAVLQLFGPIMQRLTETAPGMSAHFLRLDATVSERLVGGEIDFAVLPDQIELGLPSSELFEDTWVCAACAKHPSLSEHLTVEEFLELPHLGFNISAPGNASVADEYLARTGYNRKIVASTESFAATPFLLRETRLLTLVPRRLGDRMSQAAEVRLLDLPFDLPPLRERLFWNPRFTTSPAHTWMREQFIRVSESL